MLPNSKLPLSMTHSSDLAREAFVNDLHKALLDGGHFDAAVATELLNDQHPLLADDVVSDEKARRLGKWQVFATAIAPLVQTYDRHANPSRGRRMWNRIRRVLSILHISI